MTMTNIIKSVFISAFPVYALFVAIKTIISKDWVSGNIGLFLAAMGVIMFFTILFIRPVARTSRGLALYTIIIVIGVGVSMYPLELSRGSMSLLLLLGWLAYLFWYSKLERSNHSSIQVGEDMPILSFEDVNENMINTSSFKGAFQIYMFFRGNWCPLCMAQIEELVEYYKELERRNVDMLLISSQPHKFTRRLAEKYQIPFHFLVDKDGRVADKLQILHKNGLPFGFQVLGFESDQILPTVIITDQNNKVIFADLTDHYRVRPEPETFLRVIDDYL